mgnify:FL=1
MKHILMIATGGTIASKETADGLTPQLTSEELLAEVPELEQLCRIDTVQLMNRDSTNINSRDWLQMAACVREHYDAYDGFVLTHGTDTMAYTAAALSYLIQNNAKPVVITGSQKSIFNQDTDARENLRDAFLYACDDGACGVHIVFDHKVILGTRARKARTKSYNAFSSIDYPETAILRGRQVVYYIPEQAVGAPKFYDRLDPGVFVLKLIPGMDPGMIPEIFRLYDCVIVESFGVGGIPQQLMDAFAAGLGDYETTHKVLIMTTQVTYEGSDVGVYEVGKRVRNRFRFLEAHDMTIEAVVTKSMWLLAQNCESFDQLQQRFYRQVNFDTFYH